MANRALQHAAPDGEMHLEIGHFEEGPRRFDIQFGHGMARRALFCRLALPVTAHDVPVASIAPGRRHRAALRHDVCAAFGKAAAGRHGRQHRHLAGNRRQPAAAPRHFGQGREKRLRVGMARRREEGLAARHLDQFAGIHDADTLRHAGDNAEVVGDEQHAHATVNLNFCQ